MEGLLAASGIDARQTQASPSGTTPSEVLSQEDSSSDIPYNGLLPSEIPSFEMGPPGISASGPAPPEVFPFFEDGSSAEYFNIPDQHVPFWMEGIACQDLPPPQEASLLLQEYLEDMNKAMPLFDPAVLTQTFQDCYNGSEPEDSAAWTVVLVTLAFAHKLRGMSPVASSTDAQYAELYKNKVLRTLPSLVMKDPSLQVIQCLVGLGMLLCFEADANRSHIFITMALRMMDTRDMGFTSDKILDDQWLNVFWIAFDMDTDLAIRWNRLPTRRYEEVVSMKLPQPSNRGRICSADGRWQVDYLRLRSELSLIQARVSENLLRHTSAEAADGLLQELRDWRSHLIFMQTPRELAQHFHRSDLVTLAFLEASYHTTVFSIHTHVALLGTRKNTIFDYNTLVQVSKEKTQPCVEISRRFIDFARLLPRADVAWVYRAGHVLIASAVILLSNAVSSEQDAQILADLDISVPVLDLMDHISRKCHSIDCQKILASCQQMYERTDHAQLRRATTRFGT